MLSLVIFFYFILVTLVFVLVQLLLHIRLLCVWFIKLINKINKYIDFQRLASAACGFKVL